METKWGRLHPDEHYKTLHRGGTAAGWVIKIDDKWIARSADGSARATFDTMKEAQQFLTLIVTAGEAHESNL